MATRSCSVCGRQFEQRAAVEVTRCPRCSNSRANRSSSDQLKSRGRTRDQTCAKCHKELVSSPPPTIWDEQTYCWTCIEDTGMSAYDPTEIAIEEDFRIGFGKALLLGISSGIIVSLGASGMIIGLFALLILSFVFGGFNQVPAKPVNFLDLLVTLIFFCMFVLVFISVLGVPMSVFGTLFARRRTIRVQDGVISFEAGRREEAFPLKECYWTIRSTCADGPTIFSLSRPSIIIRSENKFIICGFESASLHFWQSFLTLSVGPEVPKHRWQRNWKPALLHLLVGAILGWVVGRIVENVVRDPIWGGIVGFLGLLDGIISAGFVLTRGHPKPTLITQTRSPRLFALFLSVIFAVLGARVGRGAGIPGLLAFMMTNGCIGWLVALNVLSHIPAEHFSSSEHQIEES